MTSSQQTVIRLFLIFAIINNVAATLISYMYKHSYQIKGYTLGLLGERVCAFVILIHAGKITLIRVYQFTLTTYEHLFTDSLTIEMVPQSYT